jgi:hypothetical protein
MRTTTSIPRIYADQNGLKHHELTEKLIGTFYAIYNELGHGFLELVYEQALTLFFHQPHNLSLLFRGFTRIFADLFFHSRTHSV